MGLELERGLELFFQKIWSKLSSIFFLCFLHCPFTSDFQRTCATLQFVHPITQQQLNLVKEWGKYWKILDERYMLSDGRFYSTCDHSSLMEKAKLWKFLEQNQIEDLWCTAIQWCKHASRAQSFLNISDTS